MGHHLCHRRSLSRIRYENELVMNVNQVFLAKVREITNLQELHLGFFDIIELQKLIKVTRLKTTRSQIRLCFTSLCDSTQVKGPDPKFSDAVFVFKANFFKFN